MPPTETPTGAEPHGASDSVPAAQQSAEADASDILDGIYQSPILPTLEDQPRVEFKPWHRPRKHYIRIHQWCKEIRRLIETLAYSNGSVVTYLGLPGEDMLDIRTLQGVLQPAGVKLRYLGFDSTARNPSGRYELNLAEHEVYALNFIDPHSKILIDRFESVINPRSIALARVRAFEPFDILNIDLCDSIANPSKSTQYFDAIGTLCDKQLKSRGNRPWLLFLTTRVGRKATSADLTQKLLECVIRNIEANPDFADDLRQNGFDLAAIRSEASVGGQMTESQLADLFGLAIGKWLLGLLNNGTSTVRVTLLQSYRYRVATEVPDMLSLAFEIETLQATLADPAGIATLPSPERSSTPSEAQQAQALLTSLWTMKDVDALLAGDELLFERMIAKCAKLLTAARYDAESYKVWARAGSTPSASVQVPPTEGASASP